MTGVQTCALPISGHGDRAPLEAYTLKALTDGIVAACDGDPGIVVGHSLGGYVALQWANGSYATEPSAVLTVGAKLSFTAEERQRMQELAAKPARLFDSEAEAVARYRKVAGLEASIGAQERHLARGVRATGGAWRLSQDPAANGIVVPPFATMLAGARCRVIASAGEHDPMVPMAQLREWVPDAVQFERAGHNAHVETPGALVALLTRIADLASV